MTNVSAVTKHFPSAEEGFTTTLSSTISAGATTVGLNSLSGYTTGEIATFIVAPTVSSEKQVFTGVVDTAGLQLTNVVWTTGTNQTHAAGTTVVDYATATHISQMSKGILEEHNQDGSHGAITATSVASTGAVSGTTGTFSSDVSEKGSTLTTIRDEHTADFVASGCVWSGDSYGSTLNASMTAGVVYINGKRVPVSSVTARAFTASRDTYVDVSDAGVISYNPVTTNAAAPSLAANSIRIAIIVTGASNIASAASINMGETTKTVPTTYVAKTGKDSLGNRIANPNPQLTIRSTDVTTSSEQNANTGGVTGIPRTIYIGDMMIQTGALAVANGYTGWQNKTLTFSPAFSEAPVVVVSAKSQVADTEADNGHQLSIRSTTSTTATIRVYHGDINVGNQLSYIAIGRA